MKKQAKTAHFTPEYEAWRTAGQRWLHWNRPFRSARPAARSPSSGAFLPGKSLQTTDSCVLFRQHQTVRSEPCRSCRPHRLPVLQHPVQCPLPPPDKAFYAEALHFPHSSPASTADVQAFPAVYRRFRQPCIPEKTACDTSRRRRWHSSWRQSAPVMPAGCPARS